MSKAIQQRIFLNDNFLFYVLKLFIPIAYALSFTGCGIDGPSAQVIISNIQVNGHAVNLLLDTGSSSTLIFQNEADKLGVKYPSATPDLPVAKNSSKLVISEPIQLAFGSEVSTTQIFVYSIPEYLQWITSHNDVAGVVGWPELKNTILAFSSDKHTVSGLTELPKNLADWLRFKIQPLQLLFLSVPMQNGGEGSVQIDTGNPSGVALSPVLWKEWKKEHPEEPLISRVYVSADGESMTSEEAWADEVQLGSLKFMDVPVHQATPAEMLGKRNNYLGTLGLFALNQFDMILDGKAGIAYLHPNVPASSTSYPRMQNSSYQNSFSAYVNEDFNWSADGVRIDLNAQAEAILKDIGISKLESQQFEQAITTFTKALELDPQSMSLHLGRGIAKLNLGDYSGALVDLNLINKQPQYLPPIIIRANAKLNVGDYAGAKADYNQSFGIVLIPTASATPVSRTSLY